MAGVMMHLKGPSMFKIASRNSQRRVSRVRGFRSDVDRKLHRKVQRKNAICAATLALQQYEEEKTPATLYRHFDVDGHLLYVGVSADASSRSRQHEHGAKWHREIATISLEHFPSRVTALEAERLAIKHEKP